jgi:kynurenine formamidase
LTLARAAGDMLAWAQEGSTMASIDFDKIPQFSELPVRKDAPADSSWGVFGDQDEFGCLNFLTPQGIIEAARLVRKGRVFRLDAPINFAKPPLFNRAPAKHTIANFEQYGILGHDDWLDNYNTQQGSQWDGYAHIGHIRHRAFYNGVKASEIKDGPDGKLSIHRWADKMVGRGVLIDVFKYRTEQGRPLNPLASESYSLKDLRDALAAQKTTLQPGSFLLIRTGWMQAYLKASEAERTAMAPMEALKSCGIDHSREMIAYFWDNRVAALGTDCPAAEPWPIDFQDEGVLHYRALALLGLSLGELFALDALAEDCAADGRWEFMLVSAPLVLEGGIASPPNAVAIK